MEEDNDKNDEEDDRTYVKKQARKRAEDRQEETNDNKRRKHIKAHKKNKYFEIPKIDMSDPSERTDEQTIH
eukprot:9335389-Heterocapsa_arctica.AAC.1